MQIKLALFCHLQDFSTVFLKGFFIKSVLSKCLSTFETIRNRTETLTCPLRALHMRVI